DRDHLRPVLLVPEQLLPGADGDRLHRRAVARLRGLALDVLGGTRPGEPVPAAAVLHSGKPALPGRTRPARARAVGALAPVRRGPGRAQAGRDRVLAGIRPPS